VNACRPYQKEKRKKQIRPRKREKKKKKTAPEKKKTKKKNKFGKNAITIV